MSILDGFSDALEKGLMKMSEDNLGRPNQRASSVPAPPKMPAPVTLKAPTPAQPSNVLTSNGIVAIPKVY